jgi:hypothetical protein
MMTKRFMKTIDQYQSFPASQKYFKKLFSKQLNTFLDHNDIIVNNQSGFRRYHSTETSLLQSLLYPGPEVF